MEITTDKRKLEIIQAVLATTEESILTKVEKLIGVSRKSEFLEAVKPVLPEKSLKELKKEQNYSPISKVTFDLKATELDIKEELEDLLNQLSK